MNGAHRCCDESHERRLLRFKLARVWAICSLLSARRWRADADRARRRIALEGIREPDRAWQDAPDHRDSGVARRSGSTSNRLSSPTASRPTSVGASGSARARRGASESDRYKESVEGLRGGTRQPSRHGLGRARRRHPVGRGLGPDAGGRPPTAVQLLNSARAVAEGSVFSDVDRAEIVFRLGVCRYKLSSISTAVALLDEALVLAERSEMPSRRASLRHDHWCSGATAVSATSRPRRGRRARARARRGRRRPSQDGRRVLPGVARRRAHGALGALAQLRRAGEGSLRRSSTTSARSAGC